ncbi:MAG: ribosome-binding factor A, partial [Clostridia bacterium]|nr:ribosome-binding factor A [Clostridia bacterium]
MDAKNSRIEKINAELQKDLYEVITRKLKNPFITEMVSITAVDTSKDLKHAKVFISVYSTNLERKERTISAL